MEWPERMNAAVDYIEANLADEIDMEKAARIASCSSFHFRRMFFAFAGETAAEYVRLRRMTLAARELSSAKTKVIDVALKYGYDSPDAFTRAFRNVHGITPVAARGPGVRLAAHPRISFSRNLAEGTIWTTRLLRNRHLRSLPKRENLRQHRGKTSSKFRSSGKK